MVRLCRREGGDEGGGLLRLCGGLQKVAGLSIEDFRGAWRVATRGHLVCKRVAIVKRRDELEGRG